MSGEAGTSGLDPSSIGRRQRSGGVGGRQTEQQRLRRRSGQADLPRSPGTNNCRLLWRPAGDGFRVIDAFSRIVRLGEGVRSPAA
jgi:exopolyphosphatase/guanosine-5'-triphosphate,3'-diphosphate pyrophosphatase